MSSKKLVFLFPGQGSQFVGMGHSYYLNSSEASAIFEEAEDTLGFPLKHYCFEGPLSLLTDTKVAQPAILTVSHIIHHLLAKEGISPSWVAGHSLGEYSGLVAVGALSFSDALRLVKQRAELMGQVEVDGGMVAIINTPRELLEEMVSRLSREGVIELANHNSPSQVVVSGEKRLLTRLVEEINGQKRGKAIMLEVSGAFHSSLMKPAAIKFRNLLEKTSFSPPTAPLIANVTARPISSEEEIPLLLERQIYSPVLWEETLRTLESLGGRIFLEIGGKVLTGLVKKTLTGVDTYSIIEWEELKKYLLF